MLKTHHFAEAREAWRPATVAFRAPDKHAYLLTLLQQQLKHER